MYKGGIYGEAHGMVSTPMGDYDALISIYM